MDPILWQEAAGFAARAHAGAVRKDGRTPYVAHVFRVALTVRDVFGCDDPIALAAALLHDTIEDTGTDYDDIAEAFGTDVADCVAALTKNMTLPEPVREPAYDEQLAGAGWRAQLVKLADTFDNYSDARASGWGTGSREKMADRCRRAIAVSTPSSENEHVARATRIVGTLIG